jgi:hypothetical protein
MGSAPSGRQPEFPSLTHNLSLPEQEPGRHLNRGIEMERNQQSELFSYASSEPSLSVAAALMHPDDVISNLQLTPAQKREILASWASDARAVPDMHSLRQLDNGAIVRVDDVLRALSALDDNVRFGRHISGLPRSLLQRQRRRPVSWPKIALRRWSKDDDDDDPPPCPAVIARSPRSPLSGGEIVHPALAVAA